ncbi:MAG: 1,4-dihydroxy-2-naphthoate polyprenyltransferase [Sarcina sp.]
MMKLKAFVNYVELPTKIASVIPFFIAILYTLCEYGEIKIGLTAVMFVAMILFDMTTTAINNYCDYKNEQEHANGQLESNNPISIFKINIKTARNTIFIMLVLASILGIILAIKTNLLVLFIGIICFVVGIFYTYGPVPISRMPLGEVFSGFFMGLLIPFLTIYINTIDKNEFGIYFRDGSVFIGLNIVSAVNIILISIPLIFCIANIMLANNICDLENDVKVKRYTLVYYLGKKMSVKLYKILYYASYIAIIGAVIAKILPVTGLIVLLSFVVVRKNIREFEKKQCKRETFIYAIKNFVIISLFYAISMIIFLLYKAIL